jgi:hypothetical protein
MDSQARTRLHLYPANSAQHLSNTSLLLLVQRSPLDLSCIESFIGRFFRFCVVGELPIAFGLIIFLDHVTDIPRRTLPDIACGRPLTVFAVNGKLPDITIGLLIIFINTIGDIPRRTLPNITFSVNGKLPNIALGLIDPINDVPRCTLPDIAFGLPIFVFGINVKLPNIAIGLFIIFVNPVGNIPRCPYIDFGLYGKLPDVIIVRSTVLPG